MEVAARATATVRDCFFTGSLSGGITSANRGTCVTAERCTFGDNAGSGAAAVKMGRLIAKNCKSSGNKGYGFSAQTQGALHLTDCSSCDDFLGVMVKGGGSLLLTTFLSKAARWMGSGLFLGGTMVLQKCHAEGSKDSGLHVSGSGSTLEASDCRLVQNGQAGALAIGGGHLVARGCKSSQNKSAGYLAQDAGSHARLIDCSSIHDLKSGCSAQGHARLHADHVHVEAAMQQCFFVVAGGTMVLRNCSAEKAQELSGVIANGVGSRLEAYSCTFSRSQQSGVRVCKGASALCLNCKSLDNAAVGYNVNGEGSMLEVSNSSSERDETGCKVWAGGKVTADHVQVRSAKFEGFGVQSGSSMVLTKCSVERSGTGAFVAGSRQKNKQPVVNSHLNAKNCEYLDCGTGMCALGAVLVASACSTVGSTGGGYRAEGVGALVTLTACTSSGDKFGCVAKRNARLTAHRLCVEGSVVGDSEASHGGIVELLGDRVESSKAQSVHAKAPVEAPQLLEKQVPPVASSSRTVRAMQRHA